MLEVVRQLFDFDHIQKEKYSQHVTFPITLGKMLEMCPTRSIEKTTNIELIFYHLRKYTDRNHFDPF